MVVDERGIVSRRVYSDGKSAGRWDTTRQGEKVGLGGGYPQGRPFRTIRKRETASLGKKGTRENSKNGVKDARC